MKTRKFIIITNSDFCGNNCINYEWVNGNRYPESYWRDKFAKPMTETRKCVLDELLTNNGIEHTIIELW